MNIQTANAIDSKGSKPLPRPTAVPCTVSYLANGKDFTIHLDLRSMNDTARLQKILFWAMSSGIEVYLTPNA